MLQFIDEKTGIPFNTNSWTDESGIEHLYTFYFDDVQSTGIYYQKRLFFLSDNEDVEVSVPSDNGIFFLSEVPANPQAEIELKDIKKFSTKATSNTVGNTTLYCINVGCYSDAAGGYEEVISFRVNNSIYRYKISADFHTQHEEYEILLHNQGINIPKDIIRSFYDTNVHESNTDWVVLNKKYKELLLNAADIIYNKGSYGSLLNSIKWFEYGDLIHLNEYWSRPIIDKLYENDIELVYSDVVKKMFENYRRTTFISISLPIKNYEADENNNIIYTKNENGECLLPELTDKEFEKWSIEDITIKLTLLGNYFSTYFMPLHLDLLYSSVEDMVMDVINMHVFYTDINTIEHVYDDDTFSISEVDDIYYTHDCEAVFGPKGKVSVYPLSKLTEEIYSKTTTAKGSSLTTAAAIPVTITTKHPERYSKVSVTACGDICDLPINFPADYEANDLKLTIYIKEIGRVAVGVNLIAKNGSSVSRSFTTNVALPEIPNFNVKILKREYPTNHDYSYNLDSDFRAFVYSDDLIDKNIFYPDSAKEYFAAMKLDNEGGTFGFSDDENYLKIVREITKSDNSIDHYDVYVVSEREMNDTEKNYDNNQNFFTRRFIPGLWKQDDTRSLSKVTQDDILLCKVDDKYLYKSGSPVWTITNESTGKSTEISNVISPMFGISLGKGIYSVTFRVKYGDHFVEMTRKNIFAVDSK